LKALKSASRYIPRLKDVGFASIFVKLGWLINPPQQQVEIYRPERDIEILQSPMTLGGEDILPGFVMNLGEF
jgi:Uma2 family endonuclease